MDNAFGSIRREQLLVQLGPGGRSRRGDGAYVIATATTSRWLRWCLNTHGTWGPGVHVSWLNGQWTKWKYDWRITFIDWWLWSIWTWWVWGDADRAYGDRRWCWELLLQMSSCVPWHQGTASAWMWWTWLLYDSPTTGGTTIWILQMWYCNADPDTWSYEHAGEASYVSATALYVDLTKVWWLEIARNSFPHGDGIRHGSRGGGWQKTPGSRGGCGLQRYGSRRCGCSRHIYGSRGWTGQYMHGSRGHQWQKMHGSRGYQWQK